VRVRFGEEAPGESCGYSSADGYPPFTPCADEFARERGKNPKSFGKGGMRFMAKDYTGRIGQTGSQVVKAPSQLSPKKSGGKVKKGGDLRNGKK